MHTLSDILLDVENGCTANNMNGTCFSYRIVCFVNENGAGRKFLAGTDYEGLRRTLEGIIRENLTMTNSVVIAAVTTVRDGKYVSLLSRSYGFSLDEFFRGICEKREKGTVNSNRRGRRAQWCQ